MNVDPGNVNPVNVNPVNVNPGNVNPVNVDPVNVNPVNVDPVNVNPVNVNPVNVDPGNVNPVNVNPVNVNPGNVNPVNVNPVNVERAPQSPMTEAVQLAKVMNITPNPERLKALKPLIVVQQQVRQSSTKVKKGLFQTPATKKAHGTIGAVAEKIGLSPDYIFKQKKTSTNRIQKEADTRAHVLEYLKREDNSYELPDKKFQTKNIQRYALADTMKNLHKKYCVEFIERSISLSTFHRGRPHFVKLNHFLKRSVCLCKSHANLGLLLEVVPALPKSTQALITEYTDEEVKRVVQNLQVEEVTYQTWEKVVKKYKDKTVSHTKLVTKVSSKDDFVDLIVGSLPDFRAHCNRVNEQFTQCQLLKETLPIGHCIVQMDYAENWNCGYLKEISAAYYSKDQVTLHPMVVKVRNSEGELITTTHVGVTSTTNHSFPTTWAFVKKLVAKLKEQYPYLTMIHFITDSPSSQYRNRYTVQMLARFEGAFNLTAAWNWLESGHGKGACDGIGGTLKRLADRLVKTNTEIQSAADFCEKVSPATKVNVIHVTAEEVDTAEIEVKSWESPAVRGLMSIHQATCSMGKIYVRPTSCYKDCCLVNSTLEPNCQTWMETKVLQVGEEEEEVIDTDNEEESGYESADDAPLARMREELINEDEEEYDDVPILELIPIMNAKKAAAKQAGKKAAKKGTKKAAAKPARKAKEVAPRRLTRSTKK